MFVNNVDIKFFHDPETIGYFLAFHKYAAFIKTLDKFGLILIVGEERVIKSDDKTRVGIEIGIGDQCEMDQFIRSGKHLFICQIEVYFFQ